MGGYMSYQRMRRRNNLMWRKPLEDVNARGEHQPYWYPEPYPWGNWPGPDMYGLVGDLNRMEWSYLGVPMGFAGPDPAEQCATATGVSLDDVRKVLRHVFMEQQ